MAGLDPGFTSLPYRPLGDAALQRARDLGATHADFRFERVRWQDVRVRDGALQGTADDQDLGFAVRVIHGGAWGFASGVHLSTDEAVRVAEAAVEVAKVSSALTTIPVEIADEPVYDDVTWVSSYLQDPFQVPLHDKTAVLIDWTDRLRRQRAVQHATAAVLCVHENKYYADMAGTRTTQQRVRLLPTFTAMGSDDERGIFDDMTSIAPPAGRGWEYVVGAAADGAWDWDSELAEVP
ncbi:MAG TPA: DNA gyrase modulator, partial [Nocardioides sp.]|nr:DNA gyrase modulator [Nocardioides sp.]